MQKAVHLCSIILVFIQMPIAIFTFDEQHIVIHSDFVMYNTIMNITFYVFYTYCVLLLFTCYCAQGGEPFQQFIRLYFTSCIMVYTKSCFNWLLHYGFKYLRHMSYQCQKLKWCSDGFYKGWIKSWIWCDMFIWN